MSHLTVPVEKVPQPPGRPLLKATPYKRPEACVLVLGDVTEKTASRLLRLLRLYGTRGLKLVVVASESTPRKLEALRDFLFSNYAFTLEVYVVSPEELSRVVGDLSRVDAVLASNSELLLQLPEELRSKAEVV
jgi:hypothetical protein